ncbi:MAG: hypothetical protein Q8O82_08830 [Pseudorhodobacter sp.]|nr:hypothetical protein [Pseudorhodobacter sp.]
MDLIKNREPSDEGIPRRLSADLVETAVVTELRRVMRAPSITAQVIAHSPFRSASRPISTP